MLDLAVDGRSRIGLEGAGGTQKFQLAYDVGPSVVSIGIYCIGVSRELCRSSVDPVDLRNRHFVN